jgi:peptidoglycan/LPS O-acetylase OafA/YrhL
MLFAMGFVSTFSLTHNTPEGEKMSMIEGLKFVGKRIVKLAPFNLFVVGFGACLGPMIGGGPFWDLFSKTMKPCETLWWTNLVFINNFYPSGSFEEKCMGWTWFVPCYV